MSVSICIQGFAPPDEYWRKHKAVHDACEDAGVEPPKATQEFFGCAAPCPDGQRVDIERAIDGNPERDDGALIDLSKLPAHVKFIRVSMR